MKEIQIIKIYCAVCQRYIRQTEECIMPWREKRKDCEDLFAQIEKQLIELRQNQEVN